MEIPLQERLCVVFAEMDVISIRLVPESYDKWSQAYLWCRANLNLLSWQYMGSGEFRFVQEQEAMLFTLRWS